MTLTQLTCSFCGRTVAARFRTQTVGGKARVRHLCPHGHPCLSGHNVQGKQGNNPGGFAHQLKCPECAAEAAANGGTHPLVELE